MTIGDQISKKLIDPEKHDPILRAIINVLEEEGEKGVKTLIERYVKEIEQEIPLNNESEA